MRYNLLLHSPAPAAGEVSEDAMREMREAMSAYGRALHDAGVLVGGEMLYPASSTTTVTRRAGTVQVQDGPFAQTREALAGVITIDVPDLDAAVGWAEKHPATTYGVIEVRATATSLIDGHWTS